MREDAAREWKPILADGKGLSVRKGQIRNVNSREIFKDSTLVAQFLRDNIDIPIFKNIVPEDIDDVTGKYKAYLGIEFEADTVKRIRLEDGERDRDLFLVSLIEHKSTVDYNVAMQLLRYMVCIWTEYAKEAEAHSPGCTERKEFHFPPILPIVYYEGSGQWTAGMRLQDRIWLSETLGPYMPDFSYFLVRIHDYSNEELLDRADEMSLLMMINKVQTAEDLSRLFQSEREKINRVLSGAPGHIVEIIAETIWSLCIKMNMPETEAAVYVKKVKERNMGYLFENMEKIDIQAERKRTADARREREKAEKERDQAEKERDQAEKERDQAEEKLEQAKMQMQQNLESERERSIRTMVELALQFGISQEEILRKIVHQYELAAEKAEEYWHRYAEK